MCKGLKKCSSCAANSIGKMGRKRKVTRRRRRVGAISKNEIQNAGMNTLYAVGGAVIANILNKQLTPKEKPKDGSLMIYVPSIVPIALGFVGAMSKNPSFKIMGYSAAAAGVVKLLKAAGLDKDGSIGIGFPRLGYNPRMGMPSPMTEMDVVQG